MLLRGLPSAARHVHLFVIPATLLFFYGKSLLFTFVLDDWWLFGPRAAREFLADPISFLKPYAVIFHYSPVTRLWNGIQSVLFWENPFPYHAVSLLLASAAAIFLFRLLRLYGISYVPSLFGALYFALAVSHMHVLLWLTTASYYYWLAIFLVLCLAFWERFLRAGKTGHLAASLSFLVLGQYTHTIAFLFPFAMAIRYATTRQDAAKLPVRKACQLLAGTVVLAAFCQFVPRIFLGGILLRTELNLDPIRLLRISYTNLTVHILPGITGLPSLFPFAPLLGISILILAIWMIRRHQWSLVLLGLVVAVMAWTIPAALFGDAASDYFRDRWRYMIIPNLGLSFAIAAILDTAFSSPSGLAKKMMVSLNLVFMVLYLVVLQMNIPVGIRIFLAQDRLVHETAMAYLHNLKTVLAKSGCSSITILDTRVVEAKPPEISGNLNIQDLDHATIHNFYFGGSDDLAGRVTFRKYDPGLEIKDRDCTYLTIGGQLISLKKD